MFKIQSEIQYLQQHMIRRKKVQRDSILQVSLHRMQDLLYRNFQFLMRLKVQLFANYRVQKHLVPANLLLLKLIASARQYFDSKEFAQAAYKTCNQIKQVVRLNTRFQESNNQKLKQQYEHFINFCQTILLAENQFQCDDIISDFNANKFKFFCIGNTEPLKLKQILFRQKSWQQHMKSYDLQINLNIDQEAWVGPYPDQFSDENKSQKSQKIKQEVEEGNGQKNQAE